VTTTDDYRWLVSDDAAAWLAVVRHELAGGGSSSTARGNVSISARLVERLRRELPPARAHLVVEQIELRERARDKFRLAERMYFTPKGLEQATDDVLAAYKAGRFPANEPVVDLCCGIGGDLMALAQRERAVGVDRDPVVAILAMANVKLLEAPAATVVADDAMNRAPREGCWHCDPDRRPGERRTTSAEAFQPSLESLNLFLTQNANAAIKLAPATEAPGDWAERGELEWLGSRGECRQQVAWFGGPARYRGQRVATIAEQGNLRTIVGQPNVPLAVAPRLGRYVYEPHAAILAARLTGIIAREQGIDAVSANTAYLTGDRPVSDPALAGFLINDELPLDRRQLRAYCRERGLARLEIKKRGVQLHPAQLRREIVAKSGDDEATIIVCPIGGRVRALFVSRLPPSAT
jgi:hypothetical protein